MANISAKHLRIVIINQFSSNRFKNQTRAVQKSIF